MRLHVYLHSNTLSPLSPVRFDADKIQLEVDGDGELYVIVDGQKAGWFARGAWTHAVDPDKTASSDQEGESVS